ncbi:MAG: aldo/keto reductase [Coprobacillaceae bacterium]
MKTITLYNNQVIPQIGLGVWKSHEDTKQAVLWALQHGYRHIDTAMIYKNEEDVGKAIKESGIPREEIYVTTKLWNEDIKEGKVREALELSLRKLQLDYVDLYLIHWPVKGSQEAYLEMEKLMHEGKIKSIGVSNFKKHHMEDLLKVANVMPAVNQMEFNPGIQDYEIYDFCKEKGIAFEAWSPLGRGIYLTHPTIVEIANRYQKSPAQAILHWLTRKDIIVLPKSVHENRIIENKEIYDFHLTDEELQKINNLNEMKRTGTDPDTIDS